MTGLSGGVRDLVVPFPRVRRRRMDVARVAARSMRGSMKGLAARQTTVPAGAAIVRGVRGIRRARELELHQHGFERRERRPQPASPGRAGIWNRSRARPRRACRAARPDRFRRGRRRARSWRRRQRASGRKGRARLVRHPAAASSCAISASASGRGPRVPRSADARRGRCAPCGAGQSSRATERGSRRPGVAWAARRRQRDGRDAS